jgi:YD repeat-containing protein
MSDMGGTARSTGNLYDLDGNRVRVIHPDTSFFTYELDGLGRPGSARMAARRSLISPTIRRGGGPGAAGLPPAITLTIPSAGFRASATI